MKFGILTCRKTRTTSLCHQITKRYKMNWKKSLASVSFGATVVLVTIMYYCGSDFCTTRPVMDSAISIPSLPRSEFEAYKQGMLPANSFLNTDVDKNSDIQLDKEDVIVFLHIQKTGGTTFGRHLVKNLDLESPCKCYKNKKRCDCFTSKKTIWLFSRYSTGWVCGLHADWTELNVCVEDAMNKKEKKIRNRKYHYITILRDPVKRYLSEWKHVQRGATWKDAKLLCNGRSPTEDEMSFCYNGTDWSGVTLNEFLECKNNLARNRQTRMLADLTKVNCYNMTGQDPEKRDQIILESAKENLLKMDFFGLTEFQKYTQKLFEYTFSLKFKDAFSQLPVTHSDKSVINEEQKGIILHQNKLDISLYQYAKDLFLQRVREMKHYENDNSGVEDYSDKEDLFDDSIDIEDVDDDEEDNTDADDEYN